VRPSAAADRVAYGVRMTPTRRARLAAPLLLAGLALAGCSSDDTGGSEGSGEGDSGSGNEVSALGVSFEVPEGWEELDPEDADIPDEEAGELAEGLGLTPEQFDQTVRSVDLFVVDGDGPQDGFLSNVNVLGQTGELPPDAQLEQQFLQLGAEGVGVSQEDAAIGEVVAVEYSLAIQDNSVEGVSYLLPRDGEVVTITVSTPDRTQTQEIGDAILESLAETS
jgi:hypothetical protein